MHQQRLEAEEKFKNMIHDQTLPNDKIVGYLTELRKGMKTPHDTEYNKEVAINLLGQILKEGGVTTPISELSAEELEQTLTNILSGAISTDMESEEGN